MSKHIGGDKARAAQRNSSKRPGKGAGWKWREKRRHASTDCVQCGTDLGPHASYEKCHQCSKTAARRAGEEG